MSYRGFSGYNYPPSGPEPIEYNDEADCDAEDLIEKLTPWAKAFFPASARTVTCTWSMTSEYSDENEDDGTPIYDDHPQTEGLIVSDARGNALEPVHLTMTDEELIAHFAPLLRADAARRAENHRCQAAYYEPSANRNTPANAAYSARRVQEEHEQAGHYDANPLGNARERVNGLYRSGMHSSPFDGAVVLTR